MPLILLYLKTDPQQPESHAPATGGQLRWTRPQRAPRSFLLAAAVLGQLLLQSRRNEVFRFGLGMIALAQQSWLHVLAFLDALDALQQIIVDALTDHGVLPAQRKTGNGYVLVTLLRDTKSAGTHL